MKNPIKLEEIKEMFIKLGIDLTPINIDNYGWTRKYKFTIYGIEYVIEWWTNQSYLKIGTHNRAAKYPFKHIAYNTTLPLVDGNFCLAFIPKLNERISMFDIEYDFEVFYIPLEKKP